MKKKILLSMILVGMIAVSGCGSQTANDAEVTDEETDAKTADEVEAEVSETMSEIYTGDDLDIDFNYQVKSTCFSSFVIGESTFYIYRDTDLEELREDGFETDVDLNQEVASLAVTDEILLHYGDCYITVKAVNPYSDSVQLKDCEIGSLTIDSASVGLTYDNKFGMGAERQDIYDTYYEPYKEDAECLTYKVGGSRIVISDFSGTLPTQLLENGELEVGFWFSDDELTKIVMEQPALLYSGLQDNIASENITSVETNEISGIMQVRDSILAEIEQAMSANGVSVDINTSTGEVVMDSSILFATDEYELTEEGKQYLDQFFATYASVIVDDNYYNSIAGLAFEGHTDTSGTYDYNLTLSQNRADAVMKYCISILNAANQEKISKITTATGYSYTDPVFTESGTVDMDASRRVAIKFYVNIN